MEWVHECDAATHSSALAADCYVSRLICAIAAQASAVLCLIGH